jgi:hypothetical protein
MAARLNPANYCTSAASFSAWNILAIAAAFPSAMNAVDRKADVVLYEEGLDDKTVNAPVNSIANAIASSLPAQFKRLSCSRPDSLF